VGHTSDGRPLSVTILGPALSDDTVLDLAARFLDEPRDISSTAQLHQTLVTPTASLEENP
jgi:Asp-tRNA(Asn)/Glu-tRNA(Gln) amidotransferase A subunit family amidase